MASEKIELDVLTMQDLFGVADANLKLLERELGVSLITRDGQAPAEAGGEENAEAEAPKTEETKPEEPKTEETPEEM